MLNINDSPIIRIGLLIIPLLGPVAQAKLPVIRWHQPFSALLAATEQGHEHKPKAEDALLEAELASSEPYVRWSEPFNRFLSPELAQDPDLAIAPELPPPPAARIEFDPEREHPLSLKDDPEYRDFIRRYIRPSHLFFTEASLSPPTAPHQLSLEEAIRRTLATNLNIQIQDVQTDIEKSRIAIEKGAFDPVIEASSTFQKNRFPQNAQEFVSSGGPLGLGALSGEPNIFAEENLRNAITFSGRRYTGLSYELAYNLNIIENTINDTSSSSLYSPEYTSILSLRITQPLARDSGPEVNLAPIKIARRNRDIAYAELQATLQQTLVEMLLSYFEFVYANEEYNIRRAEVDVFKLLIQKTQKRLEKGQGSVRQLLSIRATHAQSIDRQILAEKNLAEARSRLKEFMQPEDYTTEPNLLPSGWFTLKLPEVSRRDIIDSTLANSPELLRYQFELERDRLELKVALDQARPQLNLTAAVGNTGLDQDVNQALYSGFDRSTYSAEIGIVYSRPWDNSAAEGRVREVKKQRRQTELEIKRIQHQAVARALRYYDELAIQQRRYANAYSIRKFMEQEINEEEILVEKGQKTLVETLEFYQHLYESKIRELSVMRDLNRAKANLWFANGTLLAKLGILYKDL